MKACISLFGILGVFLFLCCSISSAVTVSTTNELVMAVENVNLGGDKNIMLADGTYILDGTLHIMTDDVTVRSVSGNRDSVVLRGASDFGPVSFIFLVEGQRFTVRDVTLRNVANHTVQLVPGMHNVSIINCHIMDAYEQLVKGPYYPDNMSITTDNGLVEGCLFEYSAGIGPQYYIGGIDVHNGRNWIVRDNVFKNIKSPEPGDDYIAEHAVHFWSASSGTLVERNTIINCDRGIGFGMYERTHSDGIIRNNMIYHDGSGLHPDVGIGLEYSTNTEVYNNTIYFDSSYSNAIEYRFEATTGVTIYNNLTNKSIAQREEASAVVANNVENAQASWFVNPSSGNLHLTSAVSSVVNKGRTISGLTDDFDGQPRTGLPDIGADEYTESGSETGSVTGWWYDPSRPATGVSIEKQGAAERIYLALYVYDGAGNPIWMAALLDKQSATTWSGTLKEYTGYPLTSKPDPSSGISTHTEGPVTLTFSGPSSAVLSWVIGTKDSMSLQPYMASLDSGTLDSRNIHGWWVDPSYPGMGFFLEAKGSTLFLAWYHYDSSDSSRWWILGGYGDVGGFTNPTTYSGTLKEVTYGTTPIETSAGSAVLTFSTKTATFTWNKTTFNLQRYLFENASF